MTNIISKFIACVVIFTGFLASDCRSLDLGLDLEANQTFDEYEIRVIRPKYFIKKNRFEIGMQGLAIVNQTFIYSYLFLSHFTYHMNDAIGFEFFTSFGGSIEKQDQKMLQNDFDITTQIIRTSNTYAFGLVWTPIYGKYQKSSGELVYFDTFISAFAGSAGLEYKYDHCSLNAVADGFTEKTVQYPSFGFGIGQRIFLNKNYSLRWDIKNQTLIYDSKDGACSDGVQSISITHNNIMLQLGMSYFL